MIPQYPTFRPLQYEDMSFFDAALASGSPVLSEYTFANLFAWRNSYRLAVSRFEDAFILQAMIKGQTRYMLPLGTAVPQSIIERLIAATHQEFIRIPAPAALFFKDHASIQVVPDRDNADYVYTAQSLIELKGSRYDGKRNLIKNFKKKYQFAYLPLDSRTRDAWYDFEKRWCITKDCDSVENLQHEREAFHEMLKYYDAFNLSGGALSIDGEIRAVALGGMLNKDMLVMHILKADPQITGLYQTMLNEYLRRHGSAVSTVNLEQDLGIDGLRKSKLSYHPLRLEECFTLQWKG